jgi:hypothetical protein
MASNVVDLPALIPTSSGATRTNQIGGLDDADALILYAGNGATTQLLIEVSQFDPTLPTSSIPNAASTRWFPLMANGTSSAYAFVQDDAALTITAVGFRGLRLVTTGADTAGTIVATISKQIRVK